MPPTRRRILWSFAVGVRPPRTRKDYETQLARILKALAPRGQQRAQLEVRWVKSAEMRKYHSKFRHKDKATDILSFGSSSPALLGSLLIDVQTAARQAKAYKHSVSRELKELFVHGVLHLLGFDHETPRDAKQMARWEDAFNQRWP